MNQDQSKPVTENDKQTYRRIRKAIGWLGLGLPLVLIILSQIPFFDTKLQPSISHFYYTNFRELFTGVICAVSLFLIRYRGYSNPVFWKNDNIMTNIAGTMALGVALIPTNPIKAGDKIYTFIPSNEIWLGGLHYFFAGSFFFILALIAIIIFPLGQHKDSKIELSMMNENNIYKICGYSMILFLILVPLSHFPYSTLVFEALALLAFGIAWLIKGRALGDTGAMGKMLYREDNKE
ncbi:MAG: hypothetical protein KA198_05265 [Chitinophagaceae bacterium]|nr:hypothetical protein [Chitinophagaceae bacterium]